MSDFWRLEALEPVALAPFASASIVSVPTTDLAGGRKAPPPATVSHENSTCMTGYPSADADTRVAEGHASTGAGPHGLSARDPATSLVVAIEATRLAREVRGIGRYVRALVPRFVAQRPNLTIDLFVKRRDVAAMVLYAAQTNMLKRVNVRPISEMRGAAADVRWYPWNTISDVPATGAVVVTVHDLAPLVFPDLRLTRWLRNRRWRRRYAAVAARATLLVVDSRFTGDEVQRVLRVPSERMRVVLLAADDAITERPSNDAHVLTTLGVSRPFVLTVGAADHRKNLALVERAMARVRETKRDVSLVLAGPRNDQSDARHERPWERTLGFVSDEALMALYRSAECVVMPSKYEGFGLPVLEAMQVGTPVICARTSSLPEVGGDAVIWVDPDDDQALAGALVELLADRDARARLGMAGRARASQFSWDETARRTLLAMDEAIAMDDCRGA